VFKVTECVDEVSKSRRLYNSQNIIRITIRAGIVARVGEIRCTELWLQNRKGRYLEGLSVNWRIILKCILKK